MDKLLQPYEMPKLQGIQTPEDFYQVLQQPAPLAGMIHPDGATPWKSIHLAGFLHVVCLTGDEGAYDPTPLNLLHCVELQDLYGGRMPEDAGRELRLIHEVVDISVERLLRGEGVVVHCQGGTGRTGTVIGCVLRRLGYPAENVVDYLDELTYKRGGHSWPESSWQAQLVRDYPAP